MHEKEGEGWKTGTRQSELHMMKMMMMVVMMMVVVVMMMTGIRVKGHTAYIFRPDGSLHISARI
ncbi:hypothetical protein EYF80_029716 [Liparis tanakae]|uniref:Uncharacterized protein n=1 Tax=Liparis tanakae TaxID=230148 RepID=A0A4Z2H2D3_9TELE|nr:hypothetical protein EYF80_029716 [Liparis tanakae]